MALPYQFALFRGHRDERPIGVSTAASLADQAEADPTARRNLGLVVQQKGTAFAIDDEHVHPAIVIEVADCQATPDDVRQLSQPRAAAGVLESDPCASTIMQEECRLPVGCLLKTADIVLNMAVG